MPFSCIKDGLSTKGRKPSKKHQTFRNTQSLIAKGCRNKFYASNHLGGAWSLPGQPYLCKKKACGEGQPGDGIEKLRFSRMTKRSS